MSKEELIGRILAATPEQLNRNRFPVPEMSDYWMKMPDSSISSSRPARR